MQYSIVIPVYNAEKTIAELVQRVIAVMASHGYTFEIILVNDASRDGSWQVITSLSSRYEEIRGYCLTVNHGQSGAVVHGLKKSKGARIITMDDDLQHRPEDIPSLIEKADQGYELVFARFPKKKHTAYKNWCSHMIRYIEHIAYNTPFDLQVTGFQLIVRRVVERVLVCYSQNTYLLGLYYHFVETGKIGNAPSSHEIRQFGTSSYTLWRSLLYFVNMLRYATSKKFKLLAFVFFLVSFGLFLDGFYLLAWWFQLINTSDNILKSLEHIMLFGGAILAAFSYALVFVKLPGR